MIPCGRSVVCWTITRLILTDRMRRLVREQGLPCPTLQRHGVDNCCFGASSLAANHQKKILANATWMMTVVLAADLVRWFQLLCCSGTWRDARPKALRWGIFHALGRLVHKARRTVVRIIDGWPTLTCSSTPTSASNSSPESQTPRRGGTTWMTRVLDTPSGARRADDVPPAPPIGKETNA